MKVLINIKSQFHEMPLEVLFYLAENNSAALTKSPRGQYCELNNEQYLHQVYSSTDNIKKDEWVWLAEEFLLKNINEPDYVFHLNYENRADPILIKYMEEHDLSELGFKIVEIPDDAKYEVIDNNYFEYIREVSRIWY